MHLFTSSKNAQLLSCVHIAQYCPIPQLVHAGTFDRLQRLGDKATVTCLPAFEKAPSPVRVLRCAHHAGAGNLTTRTGWIWMFLAMIFLFCAFGWMIPPTGLAG